MFFIMQNHRNFTFITSGAYESTAQYVKEKKRQCEMRYTWCKLKKIYIDNSSGDKQFFLAQIANQT